MWTSRIRLLMKLYPNNNPQCDCEADTTFESTMRDGARGRPLRVHRAKKVYHYRERDQAHFWHWSDQTVIKI